AECEAYLVNVQKKQYGGGFNETDFHDSMDLPWSLREGRAFLPMTIGAGVRRYFDVLVVREDKNQIELVGFWPLRLRNMFSDHTAYRLELAVMANGITEKIPVCVEWNGQWDQIRTYKDIES
ncbi:MAG: hypothetical protein O7G83_01355, partial [Proteobacteria bacterium]|nr:hypothetical protein [Pseudomonadota bacterium]